MIALTAVVRAYRLTALVDRPRLDAGLSLQPDGALPCRLEPVQPA